MTSEPGDTLAPPTSPLRAPGASAHARRAADDGRLTPVPTRVAIDFHFPSDVRYIESVVDEARHQCQQCAFPPRKCALNVPVALTEALSNAILRGNREDAAKAVRVRIKVEAAARGGGGGVGGGGFDLESCTRDPGDPANLSDENGRGLFLMRRLMDSVERYNDGGNVVRLTLRR